MPSERETLEKLSTAASTAKMSQQKKDEIWSHIERAYDDTQSSKNPIKLRRGVHMFKMTAAAAAMVAIVGGGVGYEMHHSSSSPLPGQKEPVTARQGPGPSPSSDHGGIKSTTYPTAAAAVQAVRDLQTHSAGQFNPSGPNVNLGLGITARFSGGAGQYGYEWQEGRWTVVTRFWGNSAAGTRVAKQMVTYLHTHYLPAPQQKGIIVATQPSTSKSAAHLQTTVAWQVGKQVYALQQAGNPVAALQTVVDGGNVISFQQSFVNKQVSNPQEMYQQVFIGNQVGFGIKNLGGGMSNFQYELDKTTNGGKTWTKEGTFRASHVEGVSFVSPITGYYLNNSPAYAITPDLFVTHDSGQDWIEEKLPIPRKFRSYYRSSNYPVFFTQTVGIIPVYGFKDNGRNQFLYMLMTSDGGTTWRPVTNGKPLRWSIAKDVLTASDDKQTVTIHNLTGMWKVSIQ